MKVFRKVKNILIYRSMPHHHCCVPKYYRALTFCTSIKICKTLRNHVCQLSRLACYAFLPIDKSQNASLWWRGKGLTIIVILIPLLRTPWSSSILKNILITVIFGAVRPPPVSMCCSIHLVKRYLNFYVNTNTLKHS